MAIHADCPGLTVEIYVDGKPLEEYKNPEEKDVPKTATRYVECRSGAEFAIKTNFKAPFTPVDTGIIAYLDGTKVHSQIAQPHEMLTRIYEQVETRWKEYGQWRASSFLFSDLSFVENSKATTDEQNLSSMGIISVEFAKILSKQPSSHSTGVKTILRKTGPVSEECFKDNLRSHSIKLAPYRRTEAPSWIQGPREKEPFITFQFKYRSIAALEALGIIPHSPIPSLDPQPGPIKRERSPETAPAAAAPRPKTASTTPAHPQQNLAQRTVNEHGGLRDSEIIALIKHYRGDNKGLAGQSRKRLLLLLKHYEEEDAESLQIKHEHISNESQARIKREHADHGAARGQGKKRKPEVIVLDD